MPLNYVRLKEYLGLAEDILEAPLALFGHEGFIFILYLLPTVKPFFLALLKCKMMVWINYRLCAVD